jgi:hypothetical protein
MKSAKGIILASFLIIGASPLFCANISILVIEAGMHDGKPLRGGEMTTLWENGIMDVFFESGHVVTNAQSFALKEKTAGELPGTIQRYISDAEDAGVDYFILACITYEKADDANPAVESAKPAGIEFSLFHIRPRKRIWLEHIDFGGKAYFGAEQHIRVRRTARSLLVHLGGSI